MTMTITTVFAILFVLPGVFSQGCSAPADVVIALPVSYVNMAYYHLEPFLHGLLDHWAVEPGMTHVGLVLYQTDARSVVTLSSDQTIAVLRARISMLKLDALEHGVLTTPPNVPDAIDAVHAMLTSNDRPGVHKVGVIFTYGAQDATSSDPQIVAKAIAAAGQRALADDIAMFAVSTAGTVPGFPDITKDSCRLFSLGSPTGLPALLPYLGNSICYVFDDSVHVGNGTCFPVLREPEHSGPAFTCPPTGDLYLADPRNCAYFYRCFNGQAFHSRCAFGTLFDPIIQRCNKMDYVKCFNGITCPEAEGIFPHPHNCHQFVTCHESVPHVNDCPVVSGRPLLYNSQKKWCDYEENVECAMN